MTIPRPPIVVFSPHFLDDELRILDGDDRHHTRPAPLIATRDEGESRSAMAISTTIG
ncbi:hypothetical protein GYA93_22295 [Gordonia desulfuricans]|uniref:Uncharacterized protein n=1 Tax=Gordonia desulfuricans TaxID=89051 RepID=A0A7K3LXK4_9ACTN|nr:hypothetical protein [Gordonia desulfuricans]NDK92267.1 hypothetical protein [Gordonia desulfuricans]